MVEFNVPVMTDSHWEFADYEPSNIHIYEKEFHDYVVYYVAQEDSQLYLSSLQNLSNTGTRKMRKKSSEKYF